MQGYLTEGVERSVACKLRPRAAGRSNTACCSTSLVCLCLCRLCGRSSIVHPISAHDAISRVRCGMWVKPQDATQAHQGDRPPSNHWSTTPAPVGAWHAFAYSTHNGTRATASFASADSRQRCTRTTDIGMMADDKDQYAAQPSPVAPRHKCLVVAFRAGWAGAPRALSKCPARKVWEPANLTR